MKKLTLAYLPEHRRPFNRPGVTYRVTQIVNSTLHYPGEYLASAEVQDLCDRPQDWTITINPIKED